MNLTMFDMYVFGSIDSWITTSIVLGVLCFLIAGIVTLVLIASEELFLWKSVVFLICLSGVLFTIAALIPNQKTIAMMYIVPKIANSEFMNKELPTDAKRLYSLAVKSLEESLVKTDKDSK